MCFTTRALSGVVQLGAVPATGAALFPEELLLTPVDYVAEAIARIAAEAGERNDFSGPEVYHLVTPTPVRWSTLLHYVAAYGYPILRLSDVEWRAALDRLSPSNPLFLFREALVNGRRRSVVHGKPDTARAYCALQRRGVAPCPKTGRDYFFRQLAFLEASGMFGDAKRVALPAPYGVAVDEDAAAVVRDSALDGYYRVEGWFADLRPLTPATRFVELTSDAAAALLRLRRELLARGQVPERMDRTRPTECRLEVKQAAISAAGTVTSEFRLTCSGGGNDCGSCPCGSVDDCEMQFNAALASWAATGGSSAIDAALLQRLANDVDGLIRCFPGVRLCF
eukprot:TRINITY_DN3360_c0_g1_i2.p3 TRINITY_DN3360_c0_g1~~TRINITY_DN3360_c0_g1_i2.p3  ORF type:complete len:338 (-),score=66.85 TRINITY_DN3360_c0_g1_i2:781-1794(-)